LAPSWHGRSADSRHKITSLCAGFKVYVFAGVRLRDFLCWALPACEAARMSAYVIVDIEIHDAAGYDEYRKAVGASLTKYGGKFVVRGGKIDVLEGNWEPKRIVVLEFDSAARARQWYDSEEYRKPKEMRMRASTGNLIVVEGA
jgi:uncharacterized protein (DUF1330 family)